MERPCAPRGQPMPKSPTTRVAETAKYYFYISWGGTPRGGGRRRRQSTAVWLKRPTEMFTSVSPFEGPMNIFSSAPPVKAETHRPPEKFPERSAFRQRRTDPREISRALRLYRQRHKKKSKRKMAVVPPYVGGTWPAVHCPLRGRFWFYFQVNL